MKKQLIIPVALASAAALGVLAASTLSTTRADKPRTRATQHSDTQPQKPAAANNTRLAPLEEAIVIVYAANQQASEMAEMAEHKAEGKAVRRHAQRAGRSAERNQRMLERFAEDNDVDLVEIVTVGEPVSQKPTANLPSDGREREPDDSQLVTKGAPTLQKPRRDLPVYMGLDPEERDTLRKSKGDEFDRRYLAMMAKTSDSTYLRIVELKEKYGHESLDELVSVMAPTLQKQQQGARELLKKTAS